jgi:uncharacterized membrane-anchored protein
MDRLLRAFTVAAIGLGWCGDARAQQPAAGQGQSGGINWQTGPGKAPLGSHGEIQLPPGFRFAGTRDTRTILESMGNPTDGKELGLIVPPESKDDADSWFVVFEFDAVGYVKDDEKDKLDAGALLKSIREGNEAANRERQKRGWTPVTVEGWQEPPRYDAQTNNLIWAVRGKGQEGVIVNYNTRMLGRRGVMIANLVVGPEALSKVVPTYKDLLKGYEFRSGHKYAEFRSGDKVATYGLAALVTGGAVAAAAKSGLLGKIWKFLVLGVIAVVAAFRKLFARLFGWGDSQTA